MKLARGSLALPLGVLFLAGTVSAQAPALPKPGPEHQLFQQDAGTWDATVETWMAPGAPPLVSKGTETIARS